MAAAEPEDGQQKDEDEVADDIDVWEGQEPLTACEPSTHTHTHTQSVDCSGSLIHGITGRPRITARLLRCVRVRTTMRRETAGRRRSPSTTRLWMWTWQIRTSAEVLISGG